MCSCYLQEGFSLEEPHLLVPWLTTYLLVGLLHNLWDPVPSENVKPLIQIARKSSVSFSPQCLFQPLMLFFYLALNFVLLGAQGIHGVSTDQGPWPVSRHMYSPPVGRLPLLPASGPMHSVPAGDGKAETGISPSPGSAAPTQGGSVTSKGFHFCAEKHPVPGSGEGGGSRPNRKG